MTRFPSTRCPVQGARMTPFGEREKLRLCAGKSLKAAPASKGGTRSTPLVRVQSLVLSTSLSSMPLGGQFYTSVPQHHPHITPGWQPGQSGEGDLESDFEQQLQEGAHILIRVGPCAPNTRRPRPWVPLTFLHKPLGTSKQPPQPPALELLHQKFLESQDASHQLP